MIGAKLQWLESRRNEASRTRQADPLERLEKDIAGTYEELRQLDRLGTQLVHELLPFERTASEGSAEAVARAQLGQRRGGVHVTHE